MKFQKTFLFAALSLAHTFYAHPDAADTDPTWLSQQRQFCPICSPKFETKQSK